MNWVILQKGVDAAALAGAGYLQGNSESAPSAINVAVTYAENNGIRNSELTADGSGDKAYVPSPYTTVTVTAKRTVPYAFFKLIGLSNGDCGRERNRPDAAGGRLRELHERDTYAGAGEPAHPNRGKHLQCGRPM